MAEDTAKSKRRSCICDRGARRKRIPLTSPEFRFLCRELLAMRGSVKSSVLTLYTRDWDYLLDVRDLKIKA